MGEWIALAAFLLGVANLWIHVVRFRWEDRRFVAVERRRASQDDRQDLSELGQRLRDLTEAASAHLDAPPDDTAAEAALSAQCDAVEFLAERAPWYDVRSAVGNTIKQCRRVMAPHERQAPDAPKGLRDEIGWAMAEAGRTIGARMDELRRARDEDPQTES